VDGKIYVIGGSIWIPPNWVGSSVVEEYDPMTDTWTKKSDMPTPRGNLSTCVLNGKIYAIGGNEFGKTFSVVEEYDPVADKWMSKSDMPIERFQFSASAVNEKIYTIGGTGGKEGLSATVLEYDPKVSNEGKNVQPKGKLPTTWGDVRFVKNR